ncbi:DUF6037 family protein [Bifidobacterium crudilactis]|jgi:hypothetical protein|uniref:DUF6037 family protein n=1 Tax=Bifidobacterium crudilactis TaxID=327277 RepID=UPI002F35E385
MDLPELSSVSNTIYAKYKDEGTRFKWRSKNGTATFESIFINEPIGLDENGRKYAPLMISYVPVREGDLNTWVHTYEVHKNNEAMLYASAYLGDDYQSLRNILGIDDNAPGPGFQPGNFLAAMQHDSLSVPGNWTSHKIRYVRAKPRGVGTTDGKYFCGWMNNPTGKGQSPKNYEKTLKRFGMRTASHCKKARISTCWTDDPGKAWKLPEGAIEVPVRS